MGNMEDAAGSADAEMEIVEESIDYKLNNLQQTWVGIIQELIDNGMLGQLIDALTAISEVLGTIITTIGPLPSILAGLGIRELLLNLDKVPNVIKAIQGGLDAGGILSSFFGADVDELIESASQAGDTASDAFGSSFLEGVGQIFQDTEENPITEILDSSDSSFLEGVGQVFKDTEETVGSISDMSETTQGVLENISSLNDVFGEVTETAEGTAEAVETIGETASGAGVSGVTKLAGAFKALIPILTNPITIMAAIGVAAIALYKWIDEANDRQREKIRALEKEYNSAKQELDSTNSELKRVNDQIDEIQSKGTLSLVEQEELERLQTQAEYLRIAADEQERLLRAKSQELTEENRKLFDKVYAGTENATVDYTGFSAKNAPADNYALSNPNYLSMQFDGTLEAAKAGEYNDDPTQLLQIYHTVTEAQKEAVAIIKKAKEEYGSTQEALEALREKEKTATGTALENIRNEITDIENAEIIFEDSKQYIEGIGAQVDKVKQALLKMKSDAQNAGQNEDGTWVNQADIDSIDAVLKKVYELSGTAKDWNDMQIKSIFNNADLEISKQKLQEMASAGELSEDTLKQYPKLKEAIESLDLILGDGETAWSLFKNEMLASAKAAKQVDNELSNALDSAKSWESERNQALEKLGLAKENNGEIEYDESWTNYLETIKQLNPELANNEEELEKCALANMQFSHAVDDLSKNFDSYKAALQDANALTPEYSNAINALADDLTYLTGINFSISEASDFLADANNLELLEKAINGSDEALQQLQQHASQSIRIKIDTQSLTELRTTTNKALQDVKKELAELGEGGNVDLTLRPKIDTQLLRDVGWDKVEEVAGEYATVFTKTFSNEAGDVAVNFTPIIVDENGNYVDVMEPDAFTRYCEDVIAGTREDDLKLQIGAEFTGEHAIDEAEAAAIRIHNLHELQIELGLDTDEFNAQFTGLVDWLETADLGTLEAQTYINEDPFIQALIHLANESEEMAAKIKQIFAELGWDIKWDTTKMKVPKANGSHITSTYAKDAYGNAIGPSYVRWDYEEMDVPTNIRFERTGGAGGRRSSTSGYTPRSMSPSQKSNAGSNLSKGSGGGSDSEKEDDYKETIDFFERLIKVLDQQIDLLDAHLQDVVGSFAKNMLLDAEEDAIKKKMEGYSSAIEMYSAKASEALSKVPSDVAAKLQSGAVAIDEFVGEENKEVVEAAQEYEQWADKVADCKQQIVELREELRQLELQKFKNVAQDFQELFDVRQTQIDLISKAISLFETSRDKIVGRGFYDESIEQTEKQLSKLYEKHTALSEQMNKTIAAGVNVAGDEWFEMLNAVEEVNGAILDAQTKIEEYKNAIIQLYVDSFERESKAYSNQISIRQKNIDSLEKEIALIEAAGQLAGRHLYDSQITQLTKEISTLQEERAVLTTKLNDAIANGVKAGTDEWVSMVDAIYEVDAAIKDTELSIKQTEEAIKQLYVTLFEREAERYSNETSIRDKAISALENEMSRLQGAGELIGESYYTAQRAQTEKTIAALQRERDALIKSMSEATKNGIEVGSSEWMSMVDSLYDVDAAIQTCNTSLEEFDNAILELHNATFERIQTRFDNLSSELSNMADMFADVDAATTDNKWTKEGLAQLGLQTEQYELAKKRVAEYNEEISELNKQYNNGKYSATEYTERLAKLQSEQWNEVKAADSAKKAIIELNKARIDKAVEGINKETEAYKKLISAAKEALSAQKELHDYEKSLSDQNKSIEAIQKQLVALEGDTSLSAAAKRAQLQEELAEERKSLAELEYQHSIETQQEALDQQLENYQTERDAEIETLQNSLEDAQTLLNESFETVRTNAATIGQEILTMAQGLNITMSPELTAPWQAGEAAIASYSELFNIDSSDFMTRMSEVENSEWSLQEQANNTGTAIVEMLSATSDNIVLEVEEANEKFRELQREADESGRQEEEAFAKQSDELVSQIDSANRAQRDLESASQDASRSIADAFGNRADSLVQTIEDARHSTENLTRMSDALADSLSKSIDGSYSGASATSALDSIADAAEGVASAARNAAEELSKLASIQGETAAARKGDTSTHVTTIYGGSNAGKVAEWTYNSKGQVNPSNVKYHYASGTKNVSKNQLAWTQEEGPEAIINPSDGSILTPLQRGSAVLPADQTANIWQWSRFDPETFAKQLALNMPTAGANVQTNTMQVGSLVTVNGPINDSVEMMKIAATTASAKIKQSFNQLSNGLNK